jgi:hypothetical protein
VLGVVVGFVGGVASWFLTDLVARPVRRFFQLRREIYECMLYHGNVRGLRDERGDFTENFTLEDTTRLKEAQSALRQFGTRMLSFAATEPVAAKLIGLLQYDPVKAGRSLIGLSNCLRWLARLDAPIPPIRNGVRGCARTSVRKPPPSPAPWLRGGRLRAIAARWHADPRTDA